MVYDMTAFSTMTQQLITWGTLLPTETQSTMMSMSVSVHEQTSGTTCPIFTNFFSAWLGPPVVAFWYIVYFQFYRRRHICKQWPARNRWSKYTLSDSTGGSTDLTPWQILKPRPTSRLGTAQSLKSTTTLLLLPCNNSVHVHQHIRLSTTRWTEMNCVRFYVTLNTK